MRLGRMILAQTSYPAESGRNYRAQLITSRSWSKPCEDFRNIFFLGFGSGFLHVQLCLCCLRTCWAVHIAEWFILLLTWLVQRKKWPRTFLKLGLEQQLKISETERSFLYLKRKGGSHGTLLTQARTGLNLLNSFLWTTSESFLLWLQNRRKNGMTTHEMWKKGRACAVAPLWISWSRQT